MNVKGLSAAAKPSKTSKNDHLKFVPPGRVNPNQWKTYSNTILKERGNQGRQPMASLFNRKTEPSDDLFTNQLISKHNF